jgi:putative heme-binding domain-containing protein
MRNPWLEVGLFVIVLVGLFMWAGEALTRASGSGRPAVIGEGTSVENGDAIFWGPGKCHTCHAVGPRGRSVRGPNLGLSADGDEMALRAFVRAQERTVALGREVSSTEYLVESLTDPGAHLVQGYKDEMPIIYAPPISLDPDELISVVLYLQSVGGTPDLNAITLPPQARAAPRAGPSRWEPYLDGDSLRGRVLFFDTAGPTACVTCHRVGDEGGDVGPDMTSVAGTRTVEFIVESILEPGASIANGYETMVIETTTGVILDGVVRRETSDTLWLVTPTAEDIVLARTEIARSRVQETSLMPENMAETLSVSELHDLLAYLRTLR